MSLNGSEIQRYEGGDAVIQSNNLRNKSPTCLWRSATGSPNEPPCLPPGGCEGLSKLKIRSRLSANFDILNQGAEGVAETPIVFRLVLV